MEKIPTSWQLLVILVGCVFYRQGHKDYDPMQIIKNKDQKSTSINNAITYFSLQHASSGGDFLGFVCGWCFFFHLSSGLRASCFRQPVLFT